MLNDKDVEFLQQHDIDINAAHKQLECIQQTQPYFNLNRACAVNDGIMQIKETKPYIDLWRQAQQSLSITKFVPASGAATRMFKELLAFYNDPQQTSPQVEKFFHDLPNYAFYQSIPENKRKDNRELLQYLLTDEGLNYAQLPKALLLFHSKPQPRLAFEEHLAEAVNYIKRDRKCHLHFTVTKEHLPMFEELISQKKSTWQEIWDCEFHIDFSFQEHTTDSLSLNKEQQLWRRENGQPLLRPAGHGALLHNLNNINSDIIVLKNIDNVCPDHSKEDTFLWKKVLIGLLHELQQKTFALLQKLHQNPDENTIDEARKFAKNALHIECNEPSQQALIKFFDRPLRVCGVVPNTGEPGGGPFWVKEEYGSSCQIVEKVQISPQQSTIMQNASHFNPVDVVCGVKNWKGEKFDLNNFVNHDAFIVVEKSYQGQYLKSIERPGLWNGSMHYWNTVFVEVPITTFTPVKTVFDLVRPQHL